MSIEIRKGTLQDAERFIQLLQLVRSGMEHKEWLYLDPPEEVYEMMRDGSMRLWVAMDGGRLAGAFSVLIPGLQEYNYGYDLGFSRDELLRVVNMDTVAVHPDYRGLGLQHLLMQTAEEEIRRQGTAVLLCTVHPENKFSLSNILQQGYSIEKELYKYGSVRYVLRRDIP